MDNVGSNKNLKIEKKVSWTKDTAFNQVAPHSSSFSVLCQFRALASILCVFSVLRIFHNFSVVDLDALSTPIPLFLVEWTTVGNFD